MDFGTPTIADNYLPYVTANSILYRTQGDAMPPPQTNPNAHELM